MGQNLKIFHFKWERINIDSSKENWLEDSTSKLDKGSDFGIYQLYGDHSAYGDDVLLYVGKAQEQNFMTRLNQHWEWNQNNIKRYTRIHVGRLINMSDGTDKSWGEAINLTESLIISAVNPSLNKQDVNKVRENYDTDFLVLNWEDYGDIPTEVSSLRYSYHFWDEDSYKFKLLSE